MARNTCTKAALFLTVFLVSTHSASAAWGVYVSVRNDCSYASTVSVTSDGDSWSMNLDPGERKTVYLCNSGCTGFLGVSKTYNYEISGTIDALGVTIERQVRCSGA
jgi:hypothetical protein